MPDEGMIVCLAVQDHTLIVPKTSRLTNGRVSGYFTAEQTLRSKSRSSLPAFSKLKFSMTLTCCAHSIVCLFSLQCGLFSRVVSTTCALLLPGVEVSQVILYLLWCLTQCKSCH